MAKKTPTYIDVKQGIKQFPTRDRSEEEKNLPEYSLLYAQAIYNRYLNDKCGIRHSVRETIDRIRLYGKGAQPSSIYKDWSGSKASSGSDQSVLSEARNDKTREGWENISERVISPLPRIKTIIKGYLDKVGQDVFVDAIDPISNDMRETMKARTFTIAQQYDFINEYHVKAGIPMEEMEFLPVTQTELNLFEAMGGFKLNYAREMEKIIKFTEKISESEDYLKDAWIDDATDLGAIAARVVYDEGIKKFKYCYIDLRNFVIQYVKNNDYTRSEYAGYIETSTISELKQVMPDKDEDFWKSLAYVHRSKFGNSGNDTDDWDNFSKHSTSTGSYNYDSFNVEVLECEWVDYEASRHLIYDGVHGNKSVLPIGKETKIKPLEDKQMKRGAKQKVMDHKMRKLRGAKWVIGTDVVFDDGLVNMMDRPRNTDVMHSFRLYTLRDEPLTEQLIPIADDMALAWFRWQDARAMLPSWGHAIDVGMMENISDGNKTFNFIDVLKAWRETRNLFHQQSMSGKYEGGQTSPIQPIESLVIRALEEFIMTWEAALKRIEDVTGINLVMLGASAPQGSQVTTTQLSAQSVVHVLSPITKAIGRMEEELAETMIRRLQLAFKTRKDIADGYEDIIGEFGVELLRQAEKDAVQYGLFFEDRPSEEMKVDVLAAAKASLEARRQGMPGIDISQYTYIAQQLNANGNVKELTALLDFLQLKSEQRIQEEKERAIELQGQQNIQLEQTKVKAEAQKANLNTQGDIALEREKRQTELMKIRAQQMADNTPVGMPNSPVQPLSPQSNGQVPPNQ